MAHVLIIGGRSHSKNEAIKAVLSKIGIEATVVGFGNLQLAFEEASLANVNAKKSMDDIALLATKINSMAIYEEPKSKFISNPKNNFRKI